MSLTKLSLAGKNLIIPGQGEFGLGTGKSITFFYSVDQWIYISGCKWNQTSGSRQSDPDQRIKISGSSPS
jgi:hypothetical protein